MKKSLVIVAAALVFASACQKEQLAPEGNFSIKASREACVDTKASVSDAGTFAWVSGDAIGLYNGSGFNELTTSGSGETATFTGTVVGTPQTCAIFPLSVAKTASSVTLPASYVWKDGDAPTPMYAEYNASGLEFKHLGGLIKVTVANVPATATKFVFEADKDITGDFDITAGAISSSALTGKSKVVFTFAAGTASTMSFYVPVPVGTYTPKVSLKDNSDTELWSFAGSTPNQVTRAKLIVMPTLTITSIPGSGEGSATSVSVPANYNGTFYLPETSSDVYVNMNSTTGPVSLEYSGSNHPAKVIIDAAGKTVGDLKIILPYSHVEVLNGTYTTITAKTSLSTLVLEKEVKITGTATIQQGSATIASNNVNTVKVENTVQDEARIVLAPTAFVTTISTASSAPIVIQKEGDNQGKVGSVNATQPTAIEFQNEATDPGDISINGDVSKVNTSTSETTPGEEETTTVNADSQSALAYAFKKGYDVKLSDDIACDATSYVKDGVSLTLNLNNHKLTAPEKVLWVMNAKLDIVGPGTISETENDRYGALLVSGSGTSDVSDYTVVNVGEGVTLAGWSGIFISKDEAETYYNYGLVVNCNGAKLQSPADGHSKPGHALYINGSNINTTGNIPCINLKNTSIESTGTGIYAAGYANWNIEGGSITGNNTAIEIRAGKMTINGGTYTSKADPFDVEPNGSGTTTAGAALGISQHTTNLPLEVTVNGGTFNGAYAIWEKDVQDDVARDKIKLTVNDGTFNGAIYSQNNPNCLAKGTYSDLSALNYLAEVADVKIEMKADYEIASKVSVSQKVAINLNKHNLKLSNDLFSVGSGSLAISNGTIVCVDQSAYGTSSPIRCCDSSVMSFDDVVMTSNGSAVYVEKDCNFTIKNSTVQVKVYGITTNASNPNQNPTIKIENCTLTGNNPVLVNIPCSLNVTNSSITGKMHGAVVRGGTATFTKCVIALDYPDSDANEMANYFDSRNWGSGNMINLAAMTIGNKHATSYQYPTNVTLVDTDIKVVGDYASYFPTLYAYANSGEGLGVTLTYDEDCTFTGGTGLIYGSSNIVVNGASVNVE